MMQPTRRRALVSQTLLIAGLVLLWCLLWGTFDVLTLLTGVVLAIVVSAFFYLPAVELSGRINLWRTLVFFAKLLLDIVRASAEIAWLVLKPSYRASNAIIGVRLRTRSDLIMSWTAEAVSIVPGSIVVDIDRTNSTLYLHALDVSDDADIDRVIAEVLGTERRLILAIGSRVEADALRSSADIRRAPVQPIEPDQTGKEA
ncbi:MULTISPECIES: Na+/H+ antiporter subunit E [unclassified Plantibacter]|jgi:multicomponent Na+:H+ antiporter subunit E|uniref:Na+/H+ antiporter subunit E n=1 Tax=unclassified Plantibacter TaxID=2624265 RepID=UPI003D34C5B2